MHPIGPTSPDLTAALDRHAALLGATPEPTWYDSPTGPDGYLVDMPLEDKLESERASAAENRQWAAEAREVDEHHFYRRCAERSTVQAVAIERRVVGQARRQPTGRPRARGAGRPGHRRATTSRAGPDSDEGEPAERPAAKHETLERRLGRLATPRRARRRAG